MKIIHFALKRFPFDPKTPAGYLIAIILEYAIVGYEYLIIGCTLTLGNGAFWYAVSATKEIKRMLHFANDQVGEDENRTNEMEMKDLIKEFIHFHGTVKQLSIANVAQMEQTTE